MGIYRASQPPMRRGGQLDSIQYNVGQQIVQHNSPSTHSSPPFPAAVGARTSIDRSQPPTPVSTFPPILPSQKLSTKFASASASTYPSQAPVKRGLSDADSQQTMRSPKRRPSAIQASNPVPGSVEKLTHGLDLSEEEQLLIQLKQDQNLPWKEIAKEFEDRFGRPFQVPALQMRFKRLRERLRHWTNQDIAALEAAHDYWATNKFEIIANKMADFGVVDRWPARYCERQWAKLHPDASNPVTATISAGLAMPDLGMPTRFDTDMQNHSIDWSIPSPPGQISASQEASDLSGLAPAHLTTLPANPFLQNDNINQRTRYESK